MFNEPMTPFNVAAYVFYLAISVGTLVLCLSSRKAIRQYGFRQWFWLSDLGVMIAVFCIVGAAGYLLRFVVTVVWGV